MSSGDSENWTCPIKEFSFTVVSFISTGGGVARGV